MLGLTWAAGLVRRRSGRLAGTALGVAVAVGLLASIGSFLAQALSVMTDRAVANVAVDWQVEAQAGADPPAVLAEVRATPGAAAALPAGFAGTTGFEATTGGTVQTTGPGVVVGLPAGYAATFPGQLRPLTGSTSGVLLAQQTAANLHAAPGDIVSVGRAGLPPAPVRVDAVVDLPHADSLFQTVGAPPGAQPQAPPDNVLLLPEAPWHELFDPLAASRPDLVRHQVHIRLSHRLPHDPTAAFTTVSGAARNLEVRLAGAVRVGDNLAATLDAARSDALYAQVLFLLLGLPGAVLVALLTATVAAAGATRRRQDLGLLRTRGATTTTMVRLALAEAAVVAGAGGVLGLGIALAVGHLAFGSGTFGASPGAALAWAGGAVAVGALVAAAAVALPVWRDARALSVAAAHRPVGRLRPPRWAQAGLDLWLLAGAVVVFWFTSRGKYNLVLAPEGVPTVSVNTWALVGPALAWTGGGLFAWRLVEGFLRRGRPVITSMVRPLSAGLAGPVASGLGRQCRPLARAAVLVGLALAFATSSSVFNATYRQQVGVDARLTNGADVTVTEPPGAGVRAEEATRLARVPGVAGVEPLEHRFAYVGADLQDLYGVRPETVVRAAGLQDAYFSGGSARDLVGRLAASPDSVLVSAETVLDFQLRPGDLLRLRLRDARTGQLREVPFHYAGVVKEFPTAPSDSFLVANAAYVAAQTGDASVGAFLLDTGGASPTAVAGRVRRMVGTAATVTDIEESWRLAGSTLTAVDLRGLSRVELGFALVLVAAAAGLVLALGLAERRRTFAIARALGARRRHLGAFVRAEAAVVTAAGLLVGATIGWVLAGMLVKVLTGVFDPPPAHLAVPWAYLAVLVGLALAATAAASEMTVRAARRPAAEIIREL